mmetsp:Transcript_75600/g.179662  ORF Transcript_75600/g.179662 Transcript_75600/m.179662 type:complete len:290 (+) Transcript_75600:69-938(+)
MLRTPPASPLTSECGSPQKARDDDDLLVPEPRISLEESFGGQMHSIRSSTDADERCGSARSSWKARLSDTDLPRRESSISNDGMLDFCSICNAKLGKRFLRPRHHCRLCDRLVCGQCSPALIPLDGKQGRQIVCMDCTAVVEHQQDLMSRLNCLAARMQNAHAACGVESELLSHGSTLAAAVVVCEEEAAKLEHRYTSEVTRANLAEHRLKKLLEEAEQRAKVQQVSHQEQLPSSSRRASDSPCQSYVASTADSTVPPRSSSSITLPPRSSNCAMRGQRCITQGSCVVQ